MTAADGERQPCTRTGVHTCKNPETHRQRARATPDDDPRDHDIDCTCIFCIPGT